MKQLYPKPEHHKTRATPKKDDESRRPFHVEYYDPEAELDPEWRSYNSELAVKIAAWFRCRFLGFHSGAVLYDRDELNEVNR